MKSPFSDLRLPTRLALVMFLILASTSFILMLTYVRYNRAVKVYVSNQTSDLLQIIQVTQTRVPATSDRKQALDAYMKALTDAGLTSVTLASPTGEVVASTTPGQIGQKIKIRKRREHADQGPAKISAEFRDTDLETMAEQRAYGVEFPLVLGDKVIGYAQVKWSMDDINAFLRQLYMVRLVWILVTMLAGIIAMVYLAFRFTKPVDDLISGARLVAQGNLYVSLPTKGTGEMGRLAQTFNEMVGHLRENRRLQERLNEAEKLSLLGRFATTVAHEVRNSLNFINLSIDQIRAKHSDGDERAARELQRNLKNIKEEISRLNRLVNDVMAGGRQSPPELAPCNLRETVQQAVALVEKQAHQQSIEVSSEIPPDCPSLDADGAQLTTCFLNILTNAIQAMPRGGAIRINVHRISGNGGPSALELRFADTGSGIPAEDRDKIFAPFYSTKTTGFGLGLAITKKIVEDHHGRIYAVDNPPHGTIMVVELPLPSLTPAPEPSPVA